MLLLRIGAIATCHPHVKAIAGNAIALGEVEEESALPLSFVNQVIVVGATAEELP